MKKGQPYILWLPSWYPNPTDPFLGDFIQRHAFAAAAHIPVVVMHLVQTGAEKKVARLVTVRRVNNNLEEHILIAPFKPVGIGMIDKLRYNLRYHHFFRNYLHRFFKENGLPAGVHVHVPMKAGLIALWIKRKWNIPFILSEHNSHYLEASGDAYTKRRKWYKLLAGKVFREAEIVTNVSIAIGEILSNTFRIQQPEIIRNTVDTTAFFYKEQGKTGNEAFTFIHASGLDEQKNIAGMLHAFAMVCKEVQACRLVLAGPVSEQLHAQIKATGVEDKVRLLGMVPYKAVAQEMQSADALVIFSRHENFPCIVIEALCCGQPVVAGDVGGIKEAVNKSNGVMVTGAMPEDLARGMLQMIEAHKSYDRRQIAIDAAGLYSYEAIGSQILNLYGRIFGIGFTL